MGKPLDRPKEWNGPNTRPLSKEEEGLIERLGPASQPQSEEPDTNTPIEVEPIIDEEAKEFPGRENWMIKNRDMLYGMTSTEKQELYVKAAEKFRKQQLAAKS